MQRRLKHTKLYHAFFYFIWKERTHKPLKMAAEKSFFSSVYVIGAACFSECSLFYMITGRLYFFLKVYQYPEIFLNSILLHSLKPVLKELRILCAVPIMTQMIYLPSFFDTNFNFVTIPDFSNDVFPYKRNFSLETQILAGSMFPDCTILLSLLRRHWIQNKEQD